MSPLVVTAFRTIGRARGHFTTALAIAGFMSASAAALAFGLDAAEGGSVSFAAMVAMAAAPFLPVLAVVLGMDVWSEERRTGSVDMLLSIAVEERDLVLGKFLGVWLMTMFSSALFLLSSTILFASMSSIQVVRPLSLLAAFIALLVQGTLWSAVAVSCSAFFERAAMSAVSGVVLLVAVPRGAWRALLRWYPDSWRKLGGFPLDTQVFDIATGSVSVAWVVVMLLVAMTALFVAVKAVSWQRLRGRGARSSRWATVISAVMSVVAASTLSVLVFRFDFQVELPVEGPVSFSDRARSVLSEASGDLTVTCMLSRRDGSFRTVSRFLRSLRREAEMLGGARIQLFFVDPHWDPVQAERLIRAGAGERSVVVEKGRRMAKVPIDQDFGERPLMAAVQAVVMPPQRRDICWLSGHGEIAFDGYDAWGMSDIARDLSQEGYRNVRLELTGATIVPPGCALLVVAGARDELSRVELGKIESYLKSGGRMLMLLASPGQGGAAPLLTSWGVLPSAKTFPDARTLSGSDVISSDFADHQVTRQLRGLRIVLEKPLSFSFAALAGGGTGADRIGFSALATVSGSPVAVAIERGAGAGSDLALRPTRIVVIGDSTFAMNGQLAARANANREFFLNAVAFLSGTDAASGCERSAAVFVSGFDRDDRLHHLLYSVLAVPAGVLLLMSLLLLRRRFRH